MTDVFKVAFDWLGGMFQQHAARSVVYSRGTDSVEVKATVGKTTHEVMNNLGLVVATESRDFIIPANQIALTTGQTEPVAGDRITDLENSTEYVFEVMPFGRNSQCFKYCDASHTTLRVYTKEVDRN